jgi:hypothetical protein
MIDILIREWNHLPILYQFGFATLALIGFATLWTGWTQPEYRR